MPTYEYRCRSCGEHLEVVQSFTDEALTTCPACGGTLKKVFGNVGIVFKGSGFYKTDSRSSAKPSDGAVTADKSGPKAGEKSAEKSAEKAATSSSTGTDAGSSGASGTSSSATPGGGASVPAAAAS